MISGLDARSSSPACPACLRRRPDLEAALQNGRSITASRCPAPLRTDDPEDVIAFHEAELARLADARGQTGHELLLEIINGRPASPLTLTRYS